jgi:hypothetical protein
VASKESEYRAATSAAKAPDVEIAIARAVASSNEKHEEVLARRKEEYWAGVAAIVKAKKLEQADMLTSQQSEHAATLEGKEAGFQLQDEEKKRKYLAAVATIVDTKRREQHEVVTQMQKQHAAIVAAKEQEHEAKLATVIANKATDENAPEESIHQMWKNVEMWKQRAEDMQEKAKGWKERAEHMKQKMVDMEAAAIAQTEVQTATLAAAEAAREEREAAHEEAIISTTQKVEEEQQKKAAAALEAVVSTQETEHKTFVDKQQVVSCQFSWHAQASFH